MWVAFVFWTVWTVLCSVVGTYIAIRIVQSEYQQQQPPENDSRAFRFTSSDQFRGGLVIHD